jgi:hypothetical protein
VTPTGTHGYNDAVNTLGKIVDAVMNLNLDEQSLLMQMLESRQKTQTFSQKPRDIKVLPSKDLFEDGKLTAGGVQGIMDELNATLDNTSHL